MSCAFCRLDNTEIDCPFPAPLKNFEFGDNREAYPPRPAGDFPVTFPAGSIFQPTETELKELKL
jgi:hypothetical protein